MDAPRDSVMSSLVVGSTQVPAVFGIAAWQRLAAVGLGSALLLAACGSSSSDESTDGGFYDGQTVELIVPFDTGGGTDTIARFLGPLLSKHVEGNPRVQVVNLPGADTLIGHNEFARRPPDGLTWFMGGASGNLYHLFDNPDAQFDYAEWEALLGVPQGAVIYVAPDTGVHSPAQLLSPTSELIMGARSPEGADLARIFTLDFLGVEYTPIFGYDGTGPARIAFEQGESNLNADTTTAYIEQVVPTVEAGLAVPLYSQGQLDGEDLVRDPAVPDLPHAGEVYELLHQEQPEGQMWDAYKLLVSSGSTFNKILFIHADAPPEATQALRQGIERVLEDPEYFAGVETYLGGYEIFHGTNFEIALERILNPNLETVDFIKTYARENYDARMGD